MTTRSIAVKILSMVSIILYFGRKHYQLHIYV